MLHIKYSVGFERIPLQLDNFIHRFTVIEELKILSF